MDNSDWEARHPVREGDMSGASGKGAVGFVLPPSGAGASRPLGNTGSTRSLGATGAARPLGNTGAAQPIGNTGALGNTGSVRPLGNTGAVPSPGNTGTARPIGNTSSFTPASGGVGEGISQRVPYVHKRVPRRTQDAIDDLAQSELPSSMYTHDSNVSVRGGNLSGRGYRRSRSGMSRFQENNRYGQYLETPKGQRSIFASRELERRRRSAIALFVVVVVLIVAVVVAWRMLAAFDL